MHRPLKLIRPVHSQPLAKIRSQLLKVVNLSLIMVRPVYGIITNNHQILFQEHQNYLNNFVKHRPASGGPKTPREWATPKLVGASSSQPAGSGRTIQLWPKSLTFCISLCIVSVKSCSIFQHRPADHQQFPGKSDNRHLCSFLVTMLNLVINLSHPGLF